MSKVCLSPELRTNLLLAALPLGLALVARGVNELDAIIAGRTRRLASLEAAIRRAEGQLGALGGRLEQDPPAAAADMAKDEYERCSWADNAGSILGIPRWVRCPRRGEPTEDGQARLCAEHQAVRVEAPA